MILQDLKIFLRALFRIGYRLNLNFYLGKYHQQHTDSLQYNCHMLSNILSLNHSNCHVEDRQCFLVVHNDRLYNPIVGILGRSWVVVWSVSEFERIQLLSNWPITFVLNDQLVQLLDDQQDWPGRSKTIHCTNDKQTRSMANRSRINPKKYFHQYPLVWIDYRFLNEANLMFLNLFSLSDF